MQSLVVHVRVYIQDSGYEVMDIFEGLLPCLLQWPPATIREETEALRLTVHKERCAADSHVGQEQNRPQTSLSPVPTETLVEAEGAWTPEPHEWR